jgi:hypothetical protein
MCRANGRLVWDSCIDLPMAVFAVRIFRVKREAGANHRFMSSCHNMSCCDPATPHWDAGGPKSTKESEPMGLA